MEMQHRSERQVAYGESACVAMTGINTSIVNEMLDPEGSKWLLFKSFRASRISDRFLVRGFYKPPILQPMCVRRSKERSPDTGKLILRKTTSR